ncbi:MAG: hypothetical protein LBD46_05670 [Endomicrobium sp.]|jgi:hypothetical protein|nr:hypothetical protein [Endomicrobium sp.]
MKKNLLFLFLLIFTVATVNAKNVFAQQDKKMFLTLGFIGHGVGENLFFGGGTSFGYHSSASSLFTAEFNAEFGEAEQIGNFYYNEYRNGIFYKKHYGEIDYSYMAFEFLLSWSHIVALSQKTKFRIGPTVGVLAVSGVESYDPASVNGHDIDGLPDTHSETKTAVTAGINIGFILNIHKRWFVDFGYRLLANSKISFDEREIDILGDKLIIKEKDFGQIENQFSVITGWRF